MKALQVLNWLFYMSVSSWYSQNRNGYIIKNLLPKSSIQGVRNSTSNKLLHIPRLTTATHVLRAAVRDLALDWLAGTFLGLLRGRKPFISEPFAKYGQEKSKKWSFYCIGLDLLSGTGDDIWDQDFKQVLDICSFLYKKEAFFRSARTSCTTSGWPVDPQEKSGSLIYRQICLMNHKKTHETNQMAP